MGAINRAYNNSDDTLADTIDNSLKQTYFTNIVTARDTKDTQCVVNKLKKTVNTDHNHNSSSYCWLNEAGMNFRLPRSRKRCLAFSILVLLLLILSITIPFLVSSSKASESPVNFIPLQNVYHQLYGRESQKIRYLYKMRL